MHSRYAQQLAGLLIGLAALFAAGSLRWWERYEQSASHAHAAAVVQQQQPAPNAQQSPEDEARAARQAAGALLLFRVGSPDPGQE